MLWAETQEHGRREGSAEPQPYAEVTSEHGRMVPSTVARAPAAPFPRVRITVLGLVIPVALAVAVAGIVRWGATALFFDAFYANFLSTVAGIFFSVPVSLWLAQREASDFEASARRREDAAAARRKRTILRLLRAEIQLNLDNMVERAPTPGIGPREHIIPFLRRSVWDALSDGGELRWVDDPELLGSLSNAYHWIGTNAYLERKHYEAVLTEDFRVAYPKKPREIVEGHLVKTDPFVKAAMDVAMQQLNAELDESQ